VHFRFLGLILFCNCFIFTVRSNGILEILGWLFILVLLIREIDVRVVFDSTKELIACYLILID